MAHNKYAGQVEHLYYGELYQRKIIAVVGNHKAKQIISTYNPTKDKINILSSLCLSILSGIK